MEQSNTQPEPQEQPSVGELRPWVKPVFERVPLNEALLGNGIVSDGETPEFS